MCSEFRKLTQIAGYERNNVCRIYVICYDGKENFKFLVACENLLRGVMRAKKLFERQAYGIEHN